MENKTNFRILKLRSGENIICNISKNLKDKLIIEHPHALDTMIMVDRFGIPRQQKLIIKEWINYSKGNAISIPKDYIIDILQPTAPVLNHYLYARKNGTIIKMTKEEEELMMEEMRESLRDSEETISDVLKNYFENGIPEEMLQDIADSISDEYFIVDDDEEEDETDDEDKGPFGSRWSDWSPDPKDYI